MQRMTRRLMLFAALLAVGSCAPRSARPAATPSAPPSATAPHENLNAVLWMQTALEYEASSRQAYRLATQQLDAALKDASWTAAIEQRSDASRLPPAVILDIDETVLDNSYYQARQVRDSTVFTTESWDKWCQDARATAIPGALQFTQDAASRGVTVFYVTNRTANVEEATRKNLAALGFPLSDGVDTVLTRRERPEWEASSKSVRRAYVAVTHRVLLLIGDDLGDFTDATGTPEQRAARTAPQQEWWGRRWIVLSNPSYGSWERGIVGDAADPIGAKRRALRYEPAVPNR
jgi:5'-nucleotidase (lipoprotein e(P4) family)